MIRLGSDKKRFSSDPWNEQNMVLKKGLNVILQVQNIVFIFSLPISILTGGAGWCCWWRGCTAPPSSSSSSCSSCPSPTSSASTPSLGEPISYFDTNENPNIFLYERRSEYIRSKSLIRTNISINVRIKNILDQTGTSSALSQSKKMTQI